MSALTVDVVDAVCAPFVQEGLRLRVDSLDDAKHVVELTLIFDDIDCVDCVLPGSYLERLVEERLQARTGRSVKVEVHDPREPRPLHRGTPAAAEAGRTVTVLDPTASGRGGDPDRGPDAGSLRGKTVLFRVDPLWRSWDWTVDEWTTKLQAIGVSVRTWRRWQGIPGEEGVRLQAEYEAEVQAADILVSGLANCGSCSAWTVRDALTGLSIGLPTLAVATEHFVPLAKLLAEDGHRPGLRILALPYPLETRPEPDVRRIASEAFPEALAHLGAEV